MRDDKTAQSIMKEYVQEMHSQIDPEFGISENIRNVCIKHFPDISAEEGAEIADKILAGGQGVERMCDAYVQKGMEGVGETIDQQLTDKSLKEKYEFYCNMTVKIASMDLEVLNGILNEKEVQVEETIQSVIDTGVQCNVDVTEEMVLEAREQMLSALDHSVFTLYDVEGLKNITEDMEDYVQEFGIEDWSLEERRAYLALAAYLAYRDGKLTPEENIDPYQWAVSMAINIETRKTIHDAQSGKITWERAAMILKGIGLAAIYVGLCLAFVGAIKIFFAILFTATTLLGPSGFSLTMTIGGWAFMFMAAGSLALVEGYKKGFDTVKAFLEDKYEPVKESMENAFAYIRTRLESGYVCLRNAVHGALNYMETVLS